MHVSMYFSSVEELASRVGSRFKSRLERLLHAYRKRGILPSEHEVLRALSVAWVFFCAAQEGDLLTARNLEDGLCHRGSAVVEVGSECTPLFVDDDDPVETLAWDVACLLLEEESPESCPQEAYDIAEPHANLAYKDEVLCPVVITPPQTPTAFEPEYVMVKAADLQTIIEEQQRMKTLIAHLQAEVERLKSRPIIVNNYQPGSCNFGPGSSQNGNIQ